MGMLSGCGQKGALYIPATAPAAERATLPQTVFGQGNRPAADTAPDNTRPQHPRALPNLPETQ